MSKRDDLFAATPPLESLRMIRGICASTQHAYSEKDRFIIMSNDVKRTYFHAPTTRPLYIAIPDEDWEEGEDGSVTIRQVVYIERPSQKAIVLGKRGRRVKSLGETARKELEAILERRVHLFLFVKVRENWDQDPERYRDLGLNFDA